MSLNEQGDHSTPYVTDITFYLVICLLLSSNYAPVKLPYTSVIICLLSTSVCVRIRAAARQGETVQLKLEHGGPLKPHPHCLSTLLFVEKLDTGAKTFQNSVALFQLAVGLTSCAGAQDVTPAGCSGIEPPPPKVSNTRTNILKV